MESKKEQTQPTEIKPTEKKTEKGAKIFEEIVEIDGKKMKHIKTYEPKLVKEYIPKGVLARQKLQPFNVAKTGEASRLDKNPVFFEVHGKGKQIKVKVDTSVKINKELHDIDRAIEDEKMKMKELEEMPEMDFGGYRGDRRFNENAAVRVSNIPFTMTNKEIREIFSKYGRIVMLTMPRPLAVTEEQKRNQKRQEKRAKKMAKKMAAGAKGKDAEKEKEKEEEEKKKEQQKAQEPEDTHRGFAFIYYENPDDAAAAIKSQNDKAYYSQIISVTKAKPRPRR